jgi:hypothetical protein
MLDLAHRAWPEVTDRKQLLLRLAAEGRDALALRLDEADGAHRRAEQLKAMQRATTLMDVESLLADAAWQ